MNYTPIEQRIIDLLSDGLPHHPYELIECIYPNIKEPSKYKHNITAHIFYLRAKVRAKGEDIVTELRKGGYHYRHVILLSGTVIANDPL